MDGRRKSIQRRFELLGCNATWILCLHPHKKHLIHISDITDTPGENGAIEGRDVHIP
jgi:hypothetical protein